MVTVKDMEQKSIDTIRTLSMDAVQKAESGHPGTPMALAPVAYLLYTKYLRHNPSDPSWPDRDRFILSNGHASMLLYSTLYLAGYDIPFEELENFRQWGSMTPGHPEYGDTPGVETTTGPLGQGCGNSVGMAMAEAHLAARFNTDDHQIVDHYTYVLTSDGDMMEGVSHEAAALAGHLKLGKLIWMFDDNRITIGGSTELSMSEDVRARFDAYGWHTLDVADVNDLDELSAALEAAQAQTDRPSFIRIRTHIGYGAPNKQDTSDAHGAPLGDDEIRETKRFYGWPEDETFYVPDDVLEHFRQAKERGQELQQEWEQTFEAWAAANPDLAQEWTRIQRNELPENWHESLPTFNAEDGKEATRKASGKVINEIAGTLPELMGGSADLAPSTKTLIDASGEFQAGSYAERNVRFGVREHGMGAAVSGMALHGGVRPYGATFLIFSDYMRPTIRLASIMEQPAIYVWTHDSIALGEDGPTHQPIEHLMSLRAIPGFTLLRPADANETAVAWRVAIERRKGPVGLVLTRQGLPILDPTEYPITEGVPRGAYVLAEASNGSPQIILIGTGSEVSLALASQETLEAEGIPTRVVSMPSWELFEEQDESYRQDVLPSNVRKLAIEAGSPLGWHKYVGDDGDVIGLDRFGASAPSEVVYDKLGFNVDHVVARAKDLIG